MVCIYIEGLNEYNALSGCGKFPAFLQSSDGVLENIMFLLAFAENKVLLKSH